MPTNLREKAAILLQRVITRRAGSSAPRNGRLGLDSFRYEAVRPDLDF